MHGGDIRNITILILTDDYDECGNVNSDGVLNILDIVILVNSILNF